LTGKIKIPPHLVYSGKTTRGNRVLKELREKKGYPGDCTYNVQEKAWFDEEVLIDWIENHWRPFLDLHKIEFAYLLLDKCKVHMTSRVRESFALNKTEVDYVPAGYTSKLQPLDVGINAPFKSYIRHDVERFMVDNPGLKVKVHRRDVARWISDAWAKISSTIIVNSWRKSGYDGGERLIIDHAVHANYDDDEEVDTEYDTIINTVVGTQ
jgi:hypothetical protein